MSSIAQDEVVARSHCQPRAVKKVLKESMGRAKTPESHHRPRRLHTIQQVRFCDGILPSASSYLHPTYTLLRANAADCRGGSIYVVLITFSNGYLFVHFVLRRLLAQLAQVIT